MEKILSEYLESMEKYLKPIAVSQRDDIIEEIKSEIQEFQNNNVPSEQIIERLGSPKNLAKAYVAHLLSKDAKFSWSRFLVMCAFYSLVGFSGMIIIPCLAIIAPSFFLCGVACPILVAAKMLDHIFRFGIPYVDHIGIFLDGLGAVNPIIEFIIALVIGVLLCVIGWGALHYT